MFFHVHELVKEPIYLDVNNPNIYVSMPRQPQKVSKIMYNPHTIGEKKKTE